MKNIIICVGIPASGKSTWCIEEMNKNPGRYKRINKDLMRKMIDADVFSVSNENFILSIRDRIVEKALIKGFNVLEDNTNFGDKTFNQMCDVAKRIGDVQVVEKYFEVSLKEAKERNSKRPNPVPDSVIDQMYEKHIKNKHIDIRTEYFPPKKFEVKVFDLNKKNAIICDIDGTVAQNMGRSHFDYTRVLEDRPIQPVIDLVELLNTKYEIIFVSGRDSCYDLTKQWVDEYIDLPNGYNLFMRDTGDNRKDYIIKKEIYEDKIEPFWNIHYVLDDRKVVVDMWRSRGITVLQLNDIDF